MFENYSIYIPKPVTIVRVRRLMLKYALQTYRSRMCAEFIWLWIRSSGGSVICKRQVILV